MTDFNALFSLLNGVTKNANAYSKTLLLKFGTLTAVAEADVDHLTEALGGDCRTAAYIAVSFALASRSVTDSFRFGVKHESEDLERYFKALFLNCSVETVYIMTFDSSGRAIACDYIGEGTVNYMNVFPRKLVEKAIKRKAASAVVAHNHPGGYAEPSDEDDQATGILYSLFNAAGVDFRAHYIIGGGKCRAMDLSKFENQ